MIHLSKAPGAAFATRHRLSGLALAATLALMGAEPASAQSTASSQAEYASGRILVMPRAGLPDAALARILNDNGNGKGRRVGKTDLHIVDLPPGLEKQSVEKLSRHPHIKFAELDQLSRPNASTNDPYLGSQWHLSKIGALGAWDFSQGAGVTIAILDTGVDAAHPDLSPRLMPGWNFFNNTSDTTDAYNHGTGVAGAAAAAMNNALGVAGVSGQTRIMPIRISDASGYGSWSAMAQGLTYAADNGARVANISFASAASSSTVLSAAQYMKNKGGLVFFSAGNTGAATTVAQTSAAIVVAATDGNDARASWSTYGPVVSLSAPGVSVYTTSRGGGYVADNGTSFASPVAAGVAALVFAANPSLSAAQAESILFSSAVDLGTAGRDIYFGHGRIDAAKAVQLARSTAGTGGTDTQAPTAAITAPLANSTVSGLVAVNVNVADNVGVTKVELRVNGKAVSTDSTAPFGLSWDSTAVANGIANLTVVAYDAANNAGTSATAAVNVANNTVADTAPPAVSILTPANGAKVSGTVSIKTSSTDDAGPAGITQTLFINGKQVASAIGGALSYSWNTKKEKATSFEIRVVARDKAGNSGSQVSMVTK